jgi:ubiquinone/menaquinone biosynthesis C-methylase UbiE
MSTPVIQQQYNHMAEDYDRRWQHYTHPTLRFLLDWVDLRPEEQVLDVGCGTGELERFQLQTYPQQVIHGIDVAEAMIAVARQKCAPWPQVCFQVGRAEALPYADQTFDVVLSASAFHYFPDPVAALVAMKRVLKPGGRIVILDWCRDFLWCQICDLWLKWRDPAHHNCYTQRELEAFFQQAGLQVNAAQRQRFGFFWGLMVVSAVWDR